MNQDAQYPKSAAERLAERKQQDLERMKNSPAERNRKVLQTNNPSLKTLAQSRLESAPVSRNEAQASQVYIDPLTGRPFPGGKEQAERVAAARKAAGRPTSQPRDPATGQFRPFDNDAA